MFTLAGYGLRGQLYLLSGRIELISGCPNAIAVHVLADLFVIHRPSPRPGSTYLTVPKTIRVPSLESRRLWSLAFWDRLDIGLLQRGFISVRFWQACSEYPLPADAPISIAIHMFPFVDADPRLGAGGSRGSAHKRFFCCAGKMQRTHWYRNIACSRSRCWPTTRRGALIRIFRGNVYWIRSYSLFWGIPVSKETYQRCFPALMSNVSFCSRGWRWALGIENE